MQPFPCPASSNLLCRRGVLVDPRLRLLVRRHRLFQSTGRPQTFIALQGLAVLPLVLELFGRIGGAIGLIWYLVVLVVRARRQPTSTPGTPQYRY